MITLVMGVYMINVAYHKIDNPNGVDAYFILHCIAYGLLFVLLAFVSIQAMFGTKWKTSFEKLFLPMIIVLGFLYLLIIPIMVVPDEYVHIYTAYDMSDVMMGTHDAETVMMRQADNEHMYNARGITKEDYNSQYEGLFQRPEKTNLNAVSTLSVYFIRTWNYNWTIVRDEHNYVVFAWTIDESACFYSGSLLCDKTDSVW